MIFDLKAVLGLNRIRPFDAVADAVGDQREDIAHLIEQQLDKGEDGQGKDLGQYASIKYKGFLRPVNLKRTGAFRRAIDVIPDARSLHIVDLDSKTEKLTTRYGAAILELSTDSEAKAAHIIEPNVIDNINKQLSI